MSHTPSTPSISTFPSLDRLVTRLRDDLNNKDVVLLFAYNRTGKTRLSVAFKEDGKRRNDGGADTLYFNSFTEDLFTWDNDLENDTDRQLRLNYDSIFFEGLKDLALDETIAGYLARYTDLDFDIDYEQWTVTFSREILAMEEGGEKSKTVEGIKISRGEERIFVWSLFMAICERVIDGHPSYDWVDFLYIDDPISSLDYNNAIAVASDLAGLLRKGKERKNEGGASWPLKVVFSSHHALFFNVMCNEFKRGDSKRYFLHRPGREGSYTLRATNDTPFFHHVAMLAELQKAAESGELFTYRFNMLRSIMEKTATFFGASQFSYCLQGVTDQALYARALNILSHGKYAIYEPKEMVPDNKDLFRSILAAFLDRFDFDLPDVLPPQPSPAP